MAKDAVVTLPNRDEMLKRLVSVSDESHFQERFYPILLRSANRELVAGGVVMMFTLAIHDYTKGMPPMMANLVYMYVPRFIDALVDDKQVASDAKKFLQEAIDATSK
jgi:hypothetical protein